ncbi:MAG: class B sortase [Oscillospiraceae bacterium]|nr:class B sortase [Oscillospiraceae bacterium]
MKRYTKVLFIAAIVLLVGIFLYSGISLLVYYLESRESQQVYNDLANLVEQARPDPKPGVSEGPDDPETPISSYVTVLDPRTGEPVELLSEYAQVYQRNPDLVGWISIEDTAINYPVVQSALNKVDYYLYRDFNGKSDSHGCIYVREQCDVFAPSDNLTIYGHRMKDHTMFGHLAKYEKKDFWQTHQHIRFDTLKERHTYQIVAVFTTTATLGQGFSYHLFVDADSEAEFNSFLASCKRLSLYDTGITASYGDKLITLSTCEYTQENGRLVVVAKRID